MLPAALRPTGALRPAPAIVVLWAVLWAVLMAAAVLLAAAVLPAGPAAAQDAQFENARNIRLRQTFDSIDRDRNRQITYEEVKSDRRRQFQIFDANGDEAIIEGEWMGYQSRFHAKNLTRLQFERLRRKFYRMDRDHDKRVTLPEFNVPGLQNFSILDENRDGMVTWEEYSRPRNPLERAKTRGWSSW